ncbi:MAG: diaminopimelate decarboxylase [Calditrichaeota bacterium]|nr:diaminopimelate decarboxylase [Calditrichota bacterium]
MRDFYYKDNTLFAEDVPLTEIVSKVGTPVYVYSKRHFIERLRSVEKAFGGQEHLTCFALKANNNPEVLKLFAREGAGADVVSAGELAMALAAGIPPEKIVFAGVGKRNDEIAFALEKSIRAFNVESEQELEVINEIAGQVQRKAPVNIRVNPDIDPKSHPYISTGMAKNKFGIAIGKSYAVFEKAAALPNIRLLGVHSHIGSQILSVDPFVESARSLRKLVTDLKQAGIALTVIDMGGGLGVDYNRVIDEPLYEPREPAEPPTPADLMRAILPHLSDLGCTLIFEPGRFLTANGGVLLTRVLYRKETSLKKFAIVDAGMNDLIRPSLYQAYHRIVPVEKRPEREMMSLDIVGPICESGDFFAKDRPLPEVRRGDLLAILSAGAYGYTLSSTYNGRPRIPEVLVDGASFTVVRERETIDDLIGR